MVFHRSFIAFTVPLFLVLCLQQVVAANFESSGNGFQLTVEQQKQTTSRQTLTETFTGGGYENVPFGFDWPEENLLSITALDDIDGALSADVRIFDIENTGTSSKLSPIGDWGLNEKTWITRPGLCHLFYMAQDKGDNIQEQQVDTQVLGNYEKDDHLEEKEEKWFPPDIYIANREKNGAYYSFSLQECPIFIYDSIQCGTAWEEEGPVFVRAADCRNNTLSVEMQVAEYSYDPETEKMELKEVSNNDPWTSRFGYFLITYKAYDRTGDSVADQVMAINYACDPTDSDSDSASDSECDPSRGLPLILIKHRLDNVNIGGSYGYFNYALDCGEQWDTIGPESVRATDLCGNDIDVHFSIIERLDEDNPENPWIPVDTQKINSGSWTFDPDMYRVFYSATNGKEWISEILYAEVWDNCAVYKGSGTEEDPYLIADVIDWRYLMYAEEHWDKHFKIIAHIDFENTSLLSIGTREKPFTGTVDGQGFMLSDCSIITQDGFKNEVGLFGTVKNAHLHDLQVENISVHGNQIVGGLVGNLSDSIVNDCKVQTTLSGQGFVGGIAGLATKSQITSCSAVVDATNTGHAGGLFGNAIECVIRDSSAQGKIQSGDFVGGLIGRMQNSKLEGCTSSVKIQGREKTGGACGGTAGGEIILCSASGAVTGDHTEIGGFAGQVIEGTKIFRSQASGAVTGKDATGGFVGALIEGSIRQSFAHAIVTGHRDVGGFAGRMNGGVIRNSYSRGSVKVDGQNSGGLIGNLNSGRVHNCYSTVSIDSPGTSGGLIAFRDTVLGGHVLNSYWDITTSGQTTSSGGESGTTVDMTSPHGETIYQDWDFQNIWIEDADGTLNNGYPSLNFAVEDFDDCDPDESPPEIHFEHRIESTTLQTDSGIYLYTLDCGDLWEEKGPHSVTATDNCVGYFELKTDIRGLRLDDDEKLVEISLEELAVDPDSWTTQPGIYLLRYSATDISGNTSEELLHVLIQDNCRKSG